MSPHAILKQGPDSPYSFELMSRGHRPLSFRGALTEAPHFEVSPSHLPATNAHLQRISVEYFQ